MGVIRHIDFEVPNWGEVSGGPREWRPFESHMVSLPGLRAYWKLGETMGGSFADSSGNGQHLSIVGGVSLGQAGLIGPAARFDGISGYAWRGNSILNTAAVAGEWTMCVLAKGGAQDGRFAVSMGSTTGNVLIGLSSGLSSNSQPPTHFRGRISDNSGAYLWGVGAEECYGPVWDNSWKLLVILRRGSQFRAYVNGLYRGGKTVAMGPTTMNRTAIGCLLWNTLMGYFSGYLQHVAICDAALDDAVVMDLAREAGLA